MAGAVADDLFLVYQSKSPEKESYGARSRVSTCDRLRTFLNIGLIIVFRARVLERSIRKTRGRAARHAD